MSTDMLENSQGLMLFRFGSLDGRHGVASAHRSSRYFKQGLAGFSPEGRRGFNSPHLPVLRVQLGLRTDRGCPELHLQGTNFVFLRFC